MQIFGKDFKPWLRIRIRYFSRIRFRVFRNAWIWFQFLSKQPDPELLLNLFLKTYYFYNYWIKTIANFINIFHIPGRIDIQEKTGSDPREASGSDRIRNTDVSSSPINQLDPWLLPGADTEGVNGPCEIPFG